jgi:hypothetical protein
LQDLDLGYSVDNGVLIITPKKNAGFAYQRISDALDEPTEMDFIETPLKDVVESLKIRHGIDIMLDAKAITDAGGAPDMPITLSVQGRSLRSALRMLLHDHDMAFKLTDEVLLITTADSAALRSYDVSDLIGKGLSSEDLIRLVQLGLSQTKPQPTSVVGNDPGGNRSQASSPRGRPLRSEPTNTPDRALNVDGEIVVLGNLFFIRTSDRGHMAVNDLLEDIRHRLKDSSKSATAVGPVRGPTEPASKVPSSMP